MPRGCWTRVHARDDLSFIYGQRFGRIYLLSEAQINDSVIRYLIGLNADNECHEATDPVKRIVHNRVSLKAKSIIRPSFKQRIVYRLLHYSRYIIPLNFALFLLTRIASYHSSSSNFSVEEIGEIVHGLELTTGIEDCYPRSLITSYLSLCSGKPCMILIGILSPTRNIHAWCCIGNELPYEAMPEHYMYQPLITWNLKINES